MYVWEGKESKARTHRRPHAGDVHPEIRLDIKYVGARRVRLHDCLPAKGHAERVVREDLTNARSKDSEEAPLHWQGRAAQEGPAAAAAAAAGAPREGGP